MPNWTLNALHILVPPSEKDNLLESLKGPSHWHVPMLEDDRSIFKGERRTEHEKFAIKRALSGDLSDHIARFCEKATEKPDWMPVSTTDIQVFLEDEQEGGYVYPLTSEKQIVAFSAPKLAPWKDKDEFDAFFPGEINEKGTWTETKPEKKASFQEDFLLSREKGFWGFHMQRLGTKWPPGNVRLEHAGKSHTDLWAHVHISYETPWSPLCTLASLLVPVLEKHGAKALLLWEEEDANSGWELLDPFEGRQDTCQNVQGRFLEVILGDDEEEEVSFWDHEAFLDDVLNAINDEDFLELLS